MDLSNGLFRDGSVGIELLHPRHVPGLDLSRPRPVHHRLLRPAWANQAHSPAWASTCQLDLGDLSRTSPNSYHRASPRSSICAPSTAQFRTGPGMPEPSGRQDRSRGFQEYVEADRRSGAMDFAVLAANFFSQPGFSRRFKLRRSWLRPGGGRRQTQRQPDAAIRDDPALARSAPTFPRGTRRDLHANPPRRWVRASTQGVGAAIG